MTVSNRVFSFALAKWQSTNVKNSITRHVLFLRECINDNSVCFTLESIIFPNKVSICSVLLAYLRQQNSSSKFLHRKKLQVISHAKASRSITPDCSSPWF